MSRLLGRHRRLIAAMAQGGAASGGGGGPVDPSTIANLVVWYKADNKVYNTGTTLATDGQTVSGWGDSFSTHDLGTHFADPPTFRANGLGAGKAGVELAADSNMALSTHQTADTAGYDLAFGTGTTATTIMLAQLSSDATNGGLSYSDGSTPSSDAGGIRMLSPGGASNIGYVHAFDGQYGGTYTPATPQRFAAVLDGSLYSLYVNNVLGTTHALSMTFGSPGNFVIGGPGVGSIIVREILLYNRALTSTELGQIDTYLQGR